MKVTALEKILQRNKQDMQQKRRGGIIRRHAMPKNPTADSFAAILKTILEGSDKNGKSGNS